MLGDATESYLRADIAKTAEQANADYAEGSVDAAAGVESDPEMAKSIAYQRAYYGTTAAKRQSEFETETAQEIDTLINQGATPEDIEAAFEARGREFIQSTTDLYDDPEIHRRVADRLTRWSNERATAAAGVMKERTDNELITATQAEVQNRLQRDEPLDFQATVQPLIDAGLDPVKVKTAVVDSTIAYAIETRNSEVLYELLDSRRGGLTEVAPFGGEAEVSTEIEGSELPGVGEAAAAPAPPAPPSPPVNYVMPLAGEVSSGIGRRRAPTAGASTDHNGIDIPAPIGTPVASMGPGRVVFAGVRGANGKLVVVEHADGSRASYAHLDSFDVQTGDPVSAGAVIAKVGNTGRSTGPHLHLTVRDAGGRIIDPRSLVGNAAGSNPAQAGSTAEADAMVAGAISRTAGGPPRRARPIGTPSLSPAEQLRVTNAIVQVEGMADRDENRWKEEKKDELILALDPIARAGGDIEPLLRDAAAEGFIDPLERATLANTFRGINDYVEEGEANKDLELDYAERFAAVEPNYGAISSQARRDYEAGRFGTGRAAREVYLNVITRAAGGQRADRAEAQSGSPIQAATRANARQFVSQSLGTVVSVRTGGQPPDTATRRNLMLADTEYEQLVAGGMDPIQAADQVVNKWSRLLNPTAPTTVAPGGPTRAPGAAPTTRRPGNAPPRIRHDANGNQVNGD